MMAMDQYVKYCYHNRDKCTYPSNSKSLFHGTLGLKAGSHQVSFLSLEEDTIVSESHFQLAGNVPEPKALDAASVMISHDCPTFKLLLLHYNFISPLPFLLPNSPICPYAFSTLLQMHSLFSSVVIAYIYSVHIT